MPSFDRAAPSALSVEDRLEIYELFSAYGHAVDLGAIDKFAEIFTPDGVLELRVGDGPALLREGRTYLEGVEAIQKAMADAPAMPARPEHHVTNIVITAVDGDHVKTLSNIIGPWHRGEIFTAEHGDYGYTGEFFSGVYEDELLRTPEGWRITRRAIISRVNL